VNVDQQNFFFGEIKHETLNTWKTCFYTLHFFYFFLKKICFSNSDPLLEHAGGKVGKSIPSMSPKLYNEFI